MTPLRLLLFRVWALLRARQIDRDIDDVVALVLLVAAAACLRPALRASRLDSNVVLRVG